MDDLTFLILDKLKGEPYYNSASLINLYPSDPDFEGYTGTGLLQEFSRLIDQNMLAPHPISGGVGSEKNYRLTDKGEGAYNKEKHIRVQRTKDLEIQKKISDSILIVNESVVETNQSVKTTNEFVTDNAHRQNKLTKASILVAISAVVAALAPFIYSISNNDTTQQFLIEIRAANNNITRQNQELDRLISRQNEIDSLLSQILFQKRGIK